MLFIYPSPHYFIYPYSCTAILPVMSSFKCRIRPSTLNYQCTNLPSSSGNSWSNLQHLQGTWSAPRCPFFLSGRLWNVGSFPGHTSSHGHIQASLYPPLNSTFFFPCAQVQQGWTVHNNTRSCCLPQETLQPAQ